MTTTSIDLDLAEDKCEFAEEKKERDRSDPMMREQKEATSLHRAISWDWGKLNGCSWGMENWG